MFERLVYLELNGAYWLALPPTSTRPPSPPLLLLHYSLTIRRFIYYMSNRKVHLERFIKVVEFIQDNYVH